MQDGGRRGEEGRHPHSRSGRGGAPRLARARPPFPSAPAGVGGVGNPGSGTTPGGRPGRGVASRKRAEERSSRVSPSPRPRARACARSECRPQGPWRSPGADAPRAGGGRMRAEGAGGRRLGAPCTCRAVQVAARALRPGPGPAPRRAPGGAGEAGRPVPAPFNFAAAARRAGGRQWGRSGAALLTRCRRGRPAASPRRAASRLQIPDARAAPGGCSQRGWGPLRPIGPFRRSKTKMSVAGQHENPNLPNSPRGSGGFGEGHEELCAGGGALWIFFF